MKCTVETENMFRFDGFEERLQLFLGISRMNKDYSFSRNWNVDLLLNLREIRNTLSLLFTFEWNKNKIIFIII